MKQFFFTIVLLFIILLINPIRGHAAATDVGRFATCDECGFCISSDDPAAGPPPPSSWKDCQPCLYPNASSDWRTGDTLRVKVPTKIPDDYNEDAFMPPTVKPGHHYTMLGCFRANNNNAFMNGAGAGDVTQALVNIVIQIAGGLTFLYLIYGSIIVLTSRADRERLAYGKRVIVASIVGLAFIVSAVFIVQFIAGGILRIPGFSSSP